MTAPVTHNLDSIVDITVEISPLAAPRATFNELLIIGSTVVAGFDTDERVRLYEDPADMLTDGYDETSPEYIAALIYFAQSPEPRRLWIGIQDLVTSPNESCLEAVIACRAADYSWYYVVCLNATAEDHLEIALWAESAVPSSVYGFTTSDADCLEALPSPESIFGQLHALGYGATIGQYATTQGVYPAGTLPATLIGTPIYPNNIYAIIGILGYACGQNSGLAGSAFTLKFKQEVGITVEPLTSTEVNNIENENGNVYLSYGNFYSFFEQGKMANGTFFDEKVNLDMLVNNIQLTIADLLNANPKIPQTDAGVTQLIHACNIACEQAVTLGFLGPGKWTGRNILALKTDDVLPKGYLVQAGSLADQAPSDRELRKSPPLYVAIKEAGAIHSVLIGVFVNR